MKEELSQRSHERALFRKKDIEPTLSDRFEEQVRRVPGKVAVRSGSQSLTYEVLDQAANRLANAILEECGDGVEPVGLLFEHDASAIVGILAVLKAGKTYVPLDPRFPQPRTLFMLEDAGVRLVVADSKNAPVVQGWGGAARTILNCDSLDEGLLATRFSVRVSPQTPAYILYSSGSTGQPKGVVHDHRSVLHQSWDATSTYGLEEHDRHALVLSYCFAASASEIFAALLNGATLCLFNVKTAGLDALVSWVKQEAITVIKLPLALFRLLAGHLSDCESVSEVRLVIVGGDTLFLKDVEQFREHFATACRLVNRLASTETNNMAHLIIDRETTFEGGVVPVGYPAVDKEIQILDEERTPVRVGEVGEIAVRSRYLAKGYWARDDMTSAAFHTLSEDGEDRIYFTGDMGRMREDGCLEHLGRKDAQVKIRGFRVELAEVKASLLALASVQEAEVLVRRDEPATKSLVAYLIAAAGTAPSVSAIRQALAASLPDYMLPEAYVMLDRFPITPTGKVDLQAFPAPSEDRPAFKDSPQEAQDDIERELVEIWQDILGIHPVGIRDHFFDLGGHSLAALKLVARIERHFQCRFPVTFALRAPTVEKMAALLREGRPSYVGTSLVAFQASGSRVPFFCVPPAGKTVIVFSDLARHLGQDQPFYAFQHLGMEDERDPHRSIVEMAAYYVDVMRGVQPTGPYFFGGICVGGIVAFEMACQLRAQGETVGLLAILDTVAAPKLPPSVSIPRQVLDHWREGDLPTTLINWLKLLRQKPPRIKTAIGRETGLTERIEKVWFAHRLASQVYKPEVYDGQITLFWPPRPNRDPGQLADWVALTTEELEIIEVPGGHVASNAFFRDPHAKDLARILSESLDRKSRRPGVLSSKLPRTVDQGPSEPRARVSPRTKPGGNP